VVPDVPKPTAVTPWLRFGGQALLKTPLV